MTAACLFVQLSKSRFLPITVSLLGASPFFFRRVLSKLARGTQAPNDKQQLEPMLAKTSALPEEIGEAKIVLADAGYFSEANVTACAAAGIKPLIALGTSSVLE